MQRPPLLKDEQFTLHVTHILRNIKTACYVEAEEQMIDNNNTAAHARALLKAKPPEQHTDVKPASRKKHHPHRADRKAGEGDEPGIGKVAGGLKPR